jgi:anti-anti-sigma factor
VTERDAMVTVREAHDERGCHLALSGPLDVRTAADVRLALHRALASGAGAVHLDLEAAHIGDATGFGVIVEVLRRARRAGRPLLIVAADERSRRLLRRARMGSLLADHALTGAVG